MNRAATVTHVSVPPIEVGAQAYTVVLHLNRVVGERETELFLKALKAAQSLSSSHTVGSTRPRGDRVDVVETTVNRVIPAHLESVHTALAQAYADWAAEQLAEADGVARVHEADEDRRHEIDVGLDVLNRRLAGEG
jgi:hypothetical protein